jgi:hypothetical protein
MTTETTDVPTEPPPELDLHRQTVARLRETQLPIYEAIRDHGPMTDEQIQVLLGKPASKVSTRRLDLVKLGLVEEAGTGRTRSGKTAKLWALVAPEKVAEARAAAASRKQRRRTILDASLEEKVKVVQILLKDDRVNAAVMNLQGRAGERARGRARGARSAAERERRDLKAQIEEAEREQSALLNFFKLKRHIKDTEEVMRAVGLFVAEEVGRQRDYGEATVPVPYWDEVHAGLTDIVDLALDARATIEVLTGASDADVIDVEAVEVLELDMPDFTSSGGA